MALSPMMQHYLKTKEEYPDTILFYRLGDFYEMFFEDAKTVSRELELTLTGKDCGLEERAPMCGIPHHASDVYVKKLVDRGYRVAICEQTEDPKKAKGIVKREVVRIVTPGTIMDQEELDETRNNYICSVANAGDSFGFAIADITTGRCLISDISKKARLLDELYKFTPSEIICSAGCLIGTIDKEELSKRFTVSISEVPDWYFDEDKSVEIIKKQFGSDRIEGLGIKDFPNGITAAGALFNYLYETQKSGLLQMNTITPYISDKYMLIDSFTRRNLELSETMREKQKRGSLLWVLDKTGTAMGARMLRSYIEQPLIEKEEIEARLDCVEELSAHPMDRDEMREYLQTVYDLERLISRIANKSATPRDLISFKTSLEVLPYIRQIIEKFSADKISGIYKELDPCSDIYELIEQSISDDPPLTMRDGDIIKTGFNEKVDEYRQAKQSGKQWLLELEENERARTGIKTLKIKFNRVFGYCIEVTNSFKELVPEDYTRKQTLTNAERYTMPKLKELEDVILGAEDKLNSLEYDIFCDIRDKIASDIARIQKTATAVAALDVFASLSYVAMQGRYVRPVLNNEGIVDIKEGRHPVVEKMIPNDMFIPNDMYLDNDEQRVAIITGPNMAGKSTYMRQNALIVLMAQMGSFVPAGYANIGICDRIFTRVGASDDLASGQSTFMVEMTEVANILRNATANSLLILDEIGRGTSTFDGLSIAWAVIEHISDKKKLGAKTLFATHYHELTELEGKLSGVRNFCIAVKEKGDDIVFLRKIIRGGADKSYGIQVAKLAGVPSSVLNRAKELGEQLTDADIASKVKSIANGSGNNADADIDYRQFSLFDTEENSDIEKEIAELNLSNMTPIEALNILFELQKKIGSGADK